MTVSSKQDKVKKVSNSAHRGGQPEPIRDWQRALFGFFCFLGIIFAAHALRYRSFVRFEKGISSAEAEFTLGSINREALSAAAERLRARAAAFEKLRAEAQKIVDPGR